MPRFLFAPIGMFQKNSILATKEVRNQRNDELAYYTLTSYLSQTKKIRDGMGAEILILFCR
jgi:hypothetical protein